MDYVTKWVEAWLRRQAIPFKKIIAGGITVGFLVAGGFLLLPTHAPHYEPRPAVEDVVVHYPTNWTSVVSAANPEPVPYTHTLKDPNYWG